MDGTKYAIAIVLASAILGSFIYAGMTHANRQFMRACVEQRDTGGTEKSRTEAEFNCAALYRRL